MKAPRFEAFTLAGKPVGVTVAAIDAATNSTAAIEAVIQARDPGFVRVIGFALPAGRLMRRDGAIIETIALVETETYDGESLIEWVELDRLDKVEARGADLLAKKAEAAARYEAGQIAEREAARVREAASLAVVPEEYRDEWLAAVEAKRASYCLNPLTSHAIRVGDGQVMKGFHGFYWDRTKPAAYDGGGSGYGRHAD